MKLASATMSLSELECSQLFSEEAEDGLRWRFRYGRAERDEVPETLVLGTYKHPRTGNELVGGINLHYLDQAQITDLQKALPTIMQAPNLYGRYHRGRRLLPQIFNNAYRTYNAEHIGRVEPGVFPAYRKPLQRAGKWLKSKLGKLVGREPQPQFPGDISDLGTRLGQAVQQRAAPPVVEPPPAEPLGPEIREPRPAPVHYPDPPQVGTPDEVEIASDLLHSKPAPTDDQALASEIENDEETLGYGDQERAATEEVPRETTIRYYSPTTKRLITESITF